MIFLEPSEAFSTYLLNASSSAMYVDGSVTPVTFSYTVPAGYNLFIERVLFYMEDITPFDSIDFGGVLGPLTNGVEFNVAGNLLKTWKDNIDIVETCFDFVGYPNFGKETNTGAGRWTMDKSFGNALIVRGGEAVEAVVNDDLSGLTQFRLEIQGRLRDNQYS